MPPPVAASVVPPLADAAAPADRERRGGLAAPLVSAAPLLCAPAAGPEVTPVASRIWSMMSAFLVRLVVLSDMA